MYDPPHGPAASERLETLAVALKSSAGEDPVTVLAASIEACGAVGGELVVVWEGESQAVLLATAGLGDAAETPRRLGGQASSKLVRTTRRAQPALRQGAGAFAAKGHAPLMLDDERKGLLILAFDEPPELGADPASFLAAVGRIASQALGRARRTALHDHIGRLQKVTATLADALTRSEVARAIVREGIAALGARAGSIWFVNRRQDLLELAAAEGYRQEALERFRSFPRAAANPVALAARSREPVLLESRDVFEKRFPDVAPFGASDPSRVAIPLVVDEIVVGSMAFSFAEQRIFDRDDREFLQTLANLCAQALDRADRARLYDNAARLQALTSWLAQAASPTEVARVAVFEGMAALDARAGAAVFLAADGRMLETVASFGYPQELVDEWRVFPIEAPLPVAAAASEGELLLIASPADARARWPETAYLLESIGDQALAAVPLRVAGRLAGALYFSYADEHEFDDHDEHFLGSLAELCSRELERSLELVTTKESRDRLRALLEHLHEGVIAIGPELDVVFANDEARFLLDGAELVGTKLPEGWPELSLRGLAGELVAASATVKDVRQTVADGRTIEAVGIPIDEGAILVLRDVSAQSRRDRAEREFIENAAHELRTPLAAIASAVDALQLGAKDVTTTRDAFLTGIAAQVDRLTRLSHALLLLSRAQADPASLTLEQVDLGALIAEIARTLDVRPDVRVVLDCSDACTVRSEHALLEAALANLAQNASRHTEHGEIRFTCAKRPEGYVAIEVSDTGAGMAEAVRQRAVERFYRGEDRDGQGFGLGLALAKEMVGVLGGELTIESRPRAGTLVRIALPLP